MSSSRAAPVSAIADQAERAVANARFSSYGRRLLGPRLPVPVDLETMGPEVAFAAFGAFRALRRVLEAQGSVPPGTFLIVGANVAVFARPGGVLFGDVCLNPYAVLHLNQLERLVTSAFVHRDLFHLLANMTGVLEDGAYLESRDGFGPFLARSAGLLGLSQCFLVGLSSAERRLAKVGGGAPRWLDDASRAVSGRRFDLDGAGALLPFYTSGVVGFSGVNYAFRAVACHRRPRNQIVLLLGVVPVPVQFSFWADLAMNTLIVPASGTFAGHFAGCLAGLTAVYAPRFVGMGPLGGGRRGNAGAGRAYAGRGRRLGGRYLRDDEPGAASPGGTRNGARVDPNRRKWNVGEMVVRLLRRLVSAPMVALRAASDEGATVAAHACCAVACVALQQAMRRHRPEGILSAGAVRSITRSFGQGGIF